MNNVFYKDFGNDTQQEPKINTEVLIPKPSIYLSLNEVYLVSSALYTHCRELSRMIKATQSLGQLENYHQAKTNLNETKKLYYKLSKFLESAANR